VQQSIILLNKKAPLPALNQQEKEKALEKSRAFNDQERLWGLHGDKSDCEKG